MLPDGTSTVGGHVETVGNVATCPGGGGTGTGTGSADQSPCSSSGSGSIIDADGDGHHHLGQHPARRHLDQAPVNVNITTSGPTTCWPCR